MPPASGASVVVARRVPKRARKVPKKTLERKTSENFIVVLVFIAILVAIRFFGAEVDLILLPLFVVGVLLLLVIRWTRRHAETRQRASDAPGPSTKTR